MSSILVVGILAASQFITEAFADDEDGIYCGDDSCDDTSEEALNVHPWALSTPAPDPAPQVDERVIAGVIVDNQGSPVADALVIVLGGGMARTDAQGRFEVNVPLAAASYTVLVQKEGIQIASGRLTLTSGQLSSIQVQSVPVLGPSCTRTALTDTVGKISANAEQLRNIVLEDAAGLSDSTMIRGGVTILSVRNRVTEQLDMLLVAATNLPYNHLRCPATETSCRPESLRWIKRMIGQALRHLSHEALLVNRETRNRDKRSVKAATERKRAIQRIRVRGIRNMRRIPNSSDKCS